MNELKTLTDLSNKSNYMQTKPLCFRLLQRQLRPFCKTYSLSVNSLHVKFKGSPFGIRLERCENTVKIINNNDVFSYSFNVHTNKELIKKLIKHNLFN